MYRKRGIDGHADGLKRRLMLGEIALDGCAGHAPGKGGVAAERLYIDEVAPASDALSDQQRRADEVEHRQYLHLAQLAEQSSDQKRADETAVDRKSAVPYLEYAHGVILELAPLEYDVIRSCADY